MSDSGSPVAVLCAEFFDWRLKEYPEFATFCGFHQYDDALNVHTEAAFVQRGKVAEDFLEKARAIETGPKTDWKDGDKLSLKLLTDDLGLFIKGLKYRGYLFPICYLEGIHIDFEQLISWMLFNNIKDYQMYVKRLRALPQRLLDDEGLMRLGVECGMTRSICSMEGVIKTMRGLDKPVETTVFYQPFTEVASNIDSAELKPVVEEAVKVIKEEVIPAFRKFATYIEQDYMKTCRPQDGIYGIPNGEDFYRQCLNYHTSLELTPQEVHDIGLREVARIKEEMEKCIEKTGFKGTFKEFIQHLRTEDKFYYDSREALLAGFEDICEKQIRPVLPKLFSKIPKSKLTIELVPESRGAGVMGYYLAGTLDGSRAGKFYANANNLKYCPKYEMMTLSLHEGEPGHHFQGMYSIEKPGDPAYRKYHEDMYYVQTPSRFDMHTAYIEGWGLYCEYLGKELGLYDDPYSMFGHLSFEMHRACRLVADTGLHALGWGYEKTVQYVLSLTALAEPAVRNEVRRYVTVPAQACAYKIGQMKIQELREKASQALGDKFDVREFHDEVLGCLAVPLPILESVVQEYVSRVLKE